MNVKNTLIGLTALIASCAVPKVGDITQNSVNSEPRYEVSYQKPEATQKDPNPSGRVIESTCWGLDGTSARVTYSWHELIPDDIRAQVDLYYSERCEIGYNGVLPESSIVGHGFRNKNGLFIFDDPEYNKKMPPGFQSIVKAGLQLKDK